MFVLVNYRHILRPQSCYDCFRPYGLPFTFFRDGGFGGGGGIVVFGAIGDLLVVLGTAALFAWIWKWCADEILR
jgi:hypothetical protein